MVATRTPAKTVKSANLPVKTPSRGRSSARSRDQAPAKSPSPKSGRRKPKGEGGPGVADSVEPGDVLEDLARRINTKHDQVVSGVQNTYKLAIELGGLLVNVKEQLPHGEFQRWIEDHCAFGYRSAADYMRLYEHREDYGRIDPANVQPAALLTSKGELKRLAKPRDKPAQQDVVEKPDRCSSPTSIGTGRVVQPPAAAPTRSNRTAADPEPEEHDVPEDETPLVSGPAAEPAVIPPTLLRWPGVADADEMADLDAVRESFQKALALVRATFRNVPDDPCRARRFWQAIANYRFHLCDLLVCATPQAMVACQECHGAGERSGELCPQCCGTGVVIDKEVEEAERIGSRADET